MALTAPKGQADTLPVVPKPSVTSKAELDHLAHLDAAIAPLREIKLSSEDGQRIKDAFKAINDKKPETAIALAAIVSDATGRKLIDWFRLRSGQGTPAEIRGFLDANPTWPDRYRLMQKLEEALFMGGGSAPEIRGYFKNGGPDTGTGFAAIASAYLAEGNEADAKKYALKAYRELEISPALEAGFLDRFKTYLTAEDYKWRLDRLLMDELRWAAEKKERAALVRRMLPLLSPGEQKKAKARLAVFMGEKGALKQLTSLPSETTPDWGLVFQHIQALRRAGKTDEAAKLLLGAPTDGAKIVVPDAWWNERRANAYEALKAGKPKLAFELVREAGPLTVNPAKEQAFMAGWLALRYLKNPAVAEGYFQTMVKLADGPLSRAKARYWLGRSLEAKGDKAGAAEQYRAALADPDTFHAFLARQKLEPGRQPIETSAPAEPTPDEISRFVNLDSAKAVMIAKQAGLEPYILRAFIVQLRYSLTGEAEMAMVAQLSEAIGDTQSAVRAGKTAIARGQNLVYYAYPVHTFPAFKPLRSPPETAFLLGIARQETEFNTLTVSGAGAKGLLQVMTGTAKHICRDYKIKCDISRLLSDPAYNAMLASAYIGDRLDEFTGSYVLAIAGYNAGPARARQWIREFGDPRDPKVDPIDWIERIPIEETREYVPKVLANIQMYRARLGDERTALRLEEDLNRSRIGERRSEPAGSKSSAAATKSDG